MVAVDPAFCPTCGTSLRATTVDGRERAYCPDCDRVVWRNPVPTAAVAVVEPDDRVLLVRRIHPPDAGEWGIPAGFIEYGESPRAAAARELREETGLSVAPDALSVLDASDVDHPDGRHLVSVAFVVGRDRTSGEPTAGSDAAEARFWTLADLREAGEVLRSFDHDRVGRAFDARR